MDNLYIFERYLVGEIAGSSRRTAGAITQDTTAGTGSSQLALAPSARIGQHPLDQGMRVHTGQYPNNA